MLLRMLPLDGKEENQKSVYQARLMFQSRKGYKQRRLEPFFSLSFILATTLPRSTLEMRSTSTLGKGEDRCSRRGGVKGKGSRNRGTDWAST